MNDKHKNAIFNENRRKDLERDKKINELIRKRDEKKRRRAESK